mmetsp:Transcript_61768/g.84929  ORF Transcript_61768/g.84929 Transcript_61768/m.84929 type:complete len:137 (+) Transcript_61768:292-702(+)
MPQKTTRMGICELLRITKGAEPSPRKMQFVAFKGRVPCIHAQFIFTTTYDSSCQFLVVVMRTQRCPRFPIAHISKKKKNDQWTRQERKSTPLIPPCQVMKKHSDDVRLHRVARSVYAFLCLLQSAPFQPPTLTNDT